MTHPDSTVPDTADTAVLHYTTAAIWQRSVAAGEHRSSGRGMTLEDEGFIHFCTQDQQSGVWQRFWAGIDEPVLLLTIAPARLPVPLVWENTSGGTEEFPHLYAPLPVTAVVRVSPVDGDGNDA